MRRAWLSASPQRIAVGLATALIFGLLPIVQAAGIRPTAVLRELPNARMAGSYRSGRPSRRFALSLDLGVVIGVDAGDTHLAVTVADPLLTLVPFVDAGVFGHADVHVAGAIARALTMDEAERKLRMREMRATVRERNVYRWAANLITGLARVRLPLAQPSGDPVKEH